MDRMRVMGERARRGKPRQPITLEKGDVVYIEDVRSHHKRQRVGFCDGAEVLREWRLGFEKPHGGYRTHWLNAECLVIADTPVDRSYKCKVHVGQEVLVDKLRFTIEQPGPMGGDSAKLVPVVTRTVCVSCGKLKNCTDARNPWDPAHDDVEPCPWCSTCLRAERRKVVEQSDHYQVADKRSLRDVAEKRERKFYGYKFQARGTREATEYALAHYRYEMRRNCIVVKVEADD